MRIKPNAATLQESTLAPGASVGILNFNSHLSFSSTDFGGGDIRYPKLEIEALTGGGVAGTDYDQASVAGNVSGLSAADLAMALPIPSVNFNPNALPDMTILTAVGAVSGSPFHATGTAAGTDRHWVLGANLVQYNPNTVVVIGSEIGWTALKGDANLDGTVDYQDLGDLATNYDLTVGMNWTTGDFNFDGKVDYQDLGDLATNYDVSEPPGGAAVPEPTALALLALGAVGLIRRRR